MTVTSVDYIVNPPLMEMFDRKCEVRRLSSVSVFFSAVLCGHISLLSLFSRRLSGFLDDVSKFLHTYEQISLNFGAGVREERAGRDACACHAVRAQQAHQHFFGHGGEFSGRRWRR